MASAKLAKASKYQAKLAEHSAPCAFCKRNVDDDETTYGKLYSIGQIHCHYFCALLSCCLIQKGKEEEGLFGFLYSDILAEINRSKKHRCSYCGVEGATLGCSVVKCKKQFHLPCGREKNAISLFYGNYKSYCMAHAPKQKIPPAIMSKAKARLSTLKKGNMEKSLKNLKNHASAGGETECAQDEDAQAPVCVICYEEVDGFPSTHTFWPPCCARDAWFHRTCLQRMAWSAGAHYLKCPLCNDKDTFSAAVLAQGYYIPDRDAAWELEQDAYSDMYQRAVTCRAALCRCLYGRNYDSYLGKWDIKLCVMCGNTGAHTGCMTTKYYVCEVCQPAAPDEMRLAVYDTVTLPSQAENTQRQSGPRMTGRMSIRNTKRRPNINTTPGSSSQNITPKTETDSNAVKTNTDVSREELNLKTPRRPETTNGPKQVDHELIYPLNLMMSPNKSPLKPHQTNLRDMSPLKLVIQELNERKVSKDVEEIVLSDAKLVQELRPRLEIPKPLSVKRKIVSAMLDEFLAGIPKEENAKKLETSPTKLMVPNEDVSTNENEFNASGTPIDTTSNSQEENIVGLSPKDTSETQDESISKSPERFPEISELVSENAERVSEIPGHVSEIPNDVAEILIHNTAVIDEKISAINENISEIPEHMSEISENITPDIQTQESISEIPKHSKISDENYIKDVDICENANLSRKKPEIIDDSSSNSDSSPFQLPREFIADSSNSLPPINYTPKKLKKINIQSDSMEISENNQIVNIDLVKVENNVPTEFRIPEKCALKISTLNKDVLEKTLDIDLESFKHQYLSEVDRKFSRKHEDKDANIVNTPTILKIPLDGLKKPPKRKLPADENVARKRRKTNKNAGKNKRQYKECNNDIDDTKVEQNTEKFKNKRGDEKRRYRKIKKPSREQFHKNKENADEGNTIKKYKNEMEYENCIDDIKMKRNTENFNNKRGSDEKRRHRKGQSNSRSEKFNIDKENTVYDFIEKHTKDCDDTQHELKKELNNKGNQEKRDNKKSRYKEGDERKRKHDDDLKKRRKRHYNVEKRIKRRDCIEKRRERDDEIEKRRHMNRKENKTDNTEVSIRNRNIKLKIRFKSEELNLKISKPKPIRGRKIKSETPKVFKQYVLKYDHTSPKKCIARPEIDITPVKRKYNIKTEKTSDNLKQTSIANFFKVSPKNE